MKYELIAWHLTRDFRAGGSGLVQNDPEPVEPVLYIRARPHIRADAFASDFVPRSRACRGPREKCRMWQSTRSRCFGSVARIVSVLPTALIRWLFTRLVGAMLKRMPGREFWLPFYSGEIERLDRQGLVSRYLLMSDFVESYDWTPEAADAWSGPVTILLSRKDAMVGSKMRTALLALYPDADTHVFQTKGHGAYTSDPVGFSQAVASALESQAPSRP